jgi:GNAT superfamily N-acetyltransferase
MSSVALNPTGWPTTLPPVSLLDVTPVSEQDLGFLHDLAEADRQTYDFVGSPPVAQVLRAVLESGWDGERPVTYVVRAGTHADAGTDPDTIVAAMQIWYSTYDNLAHAYIEPVVLPWWRGRGIGSALTELGEEWARRNGRMWVMTSVREGAVASEEFADRRGYVPALREVLRRQVLADVDRDVLAQEGAAARAAAADYDLVRAKGRLPEELLPALLEVELAMNDAPREDSAWEDEIPSVERLRAGQYAQELRGDTRYTVIARRRSDGAVAGQTTVSVHPDAPTYGHQQITAVARSHRGHRLGMLLKVDMLEWLAADEPQLETIDTDNAGSNDHMISINDKLGYRVTGAVWERQKRLTDAGGTDPGR